jgi:UDP-N-acetylmuramate-alanine ligase
MFVSSVDDAITLAVSKAQAGDMILTLGAGNVSQLGPSVLEKLSSLALAPASHRP